MSTDDQTVEAAIQKAGANVAPRITPSDIEAAIASEHYFTGEDAIRGQKGDRGYGATPNDVAPQPLSLLTFCVLILRNGFTVHGASGVASPENFNAEIGRQVARQNAVREIWPLMGYALKEKLHVMAPIYSEAAIQAATQDLQNCKPAGVICVKPDTVDCNLKTYIGTKIIQAEPRAKNYGPVEQQGQPGYTVVYPDGYTSWSPAEAFEAAYIDMADVTGMPDHQQRVVGEKAQLDDKLKKLFAFMQTDKFQQLCDEPEQLRLIEQYHAMEVYSQILGERIAAFTGGAA